MPEADVIARTEGGLLGLGHIVIEVADAEAAAQFYGEVLGLDGGPVDPWPMTGESRTLKAGDGQFVVLAPNPERPDLSETGVHHAFAVTAGARAKIAKHLAGRGIEVHTYVEDPPAESKDGFYFFDPDGNRIQLVAIAGAADGPPTLHHAAVQVADILWAERFYADLLGLEPVHRVGWNTADYARAQAWAEGKEAMAPGARRMDERYTSMAKNRLVPRVNMQVYFDCGGHVLGVYLANRHMQEPPEEQRVGTPRTGLRLTPAGFEAVLARLHDAGWPIEGPQSHGLKTPYAASAYLRDPGGNFIELADVGP